MARITRSQASAASAPKQESPATQTPPTTTGKKRSKAQEDAPPAKRRASTPPSKAKPAKKPAAAVKKGDVPRKTVEELKALRDGDVGDLPELNPEVPERDPGDETQYWLMKSEPDPREEDGYVIKFGIDDLAAKKTPEGWEGIRNYAARNNMRHMKRGDRAFFYHSNCKDPGVIGTMTITNEFSPDWNACINDNPYYDANAPHDGSRWSLVHVKLEHKFPHLVSLKDLRAAPADGPLANMQLLKQGRLSVNKVTQGEFDEVIRLAKEAAGPGEWEKSIEESKKQPNYSA